MASHGLCFVLVVLIVQTCVVYVKGEVIKSSLTFVIDYTLSMREEIHSVKEEVSIIFDKVSRSKASQIENFVIVTFNDPDAELRIVTKDPNKFKKALESIRLHSDFNYDCPEKSMTGIELGLTNSLPLSYLYVFTDASASDYEKLEQIKSLSQKKQSQVVFLLTGMCNTNTSDPKYQAYHEVAKASGGQVFHMMKTDVKDILKYIEESITGRGVSLLNKKYPPGTHNVKFNVDAHTGAVLITLTGLGSRIGQVTGPGGSKPPTEAIVSGKKKMAVRRLNNAKLGDYEVEIEGKGEVHIIMIGKSDLNFQLGFSIDSPTSMKDTVTRPPPGGNAFLGIRLLGEGVELTTAKITDLDDNVVAELPLTLVDKKEQFYVTQSFDPPYSIFLVTVIGNDLKTGTPVIRTGPTPIARQDLLTEPAVNTSPEVTIQGAPKIITEYDAPLKLKCNVHGYPAPDIVWSEKDTGILMPAKVHSVDVPYDYVSTLDINKANKNVSYECKASNSVGTSIKYVEVETERKIYFDVIEAPNDIRVEYTKEGSIICKIDAYPPATIAWYKDGAEFFGNTNVDISSDKSILSIKNMQPELEGKYKCEAKNALDRKVFIADVAIFGVEEPVIDKSHGVEHVTETTNAELSCRILKGTPKPDISWSFKPAGIATYSVMTETTETVHLNNVRKDQTGTYECSAKNALGSDSFAMELVVEYPPIIKSDDKIKQIKDGDEVRIPCEVTGEPAPTVSWFFKGTKLASSATILISSDYSIKFKATPSDIGDYTCEAKNKLDTAKKTVSLDVLEVPVIDKSLAEIRVPEETNAVLSCKILQGNPKPSIRWSFKSATTGTSNDMTEITETVHLKNVRKDQTGTYKCTAENDQGSDSFAVILVVEYPPNIVNDVKIKQIKDGDEVIIPCDVTGEPAPTVSWFFKGTRLASSAKILISSDYSIKFKATPSDIGDYTCEAKNKLDTAKKTVSLDVLEVPVIDKSLAEIRVLEETNAVLSCKILQGNPKPSIRWSFKSATTGTSNDMTEITETVRLKNVRKGQTGTYECSALNTQGSDSFAVNLVVEYPPNIVNDDKIKQIKDGDEVIIPCDVTGEPAPTVSWFFKGTRLASSAKILISSDYSIKFKATPSDIGDYTCEAKNKLDTAKKTVSLDVLEVPVIDQSLTEIRVPEETNAVLSCKILQGNPKPSIRWSFKSATTGTSNDMTEITETVHLKNVRKDQTGTYECTAENDQGSDSFAVNLVVEYPPNIKSDDKIKQIKDGDEVIIPCEVTGEPAPTVSWFFKGTRLASSAKILISSDYSIKFKATPSDIGDYTCEAKNKLDTAKKTVSLDVLDGPVIDKSLTDIRVPEKTNAVLSCKILQGNPKPSIRWSFKSATTGTSNDMTETTDTVLLKNVRKDRTGTYECTAENDQGSDSFAVNLVVEYPPNIVNDVKIKQIKNGDEVRIPCEVTGEPAPTVSWFFKGTKLASSATILISSDYSIKFKATPSDIGDYTCEAKNKLDTAKKTVSLDVLEVPVIDKSLREIRVTEKTNAVLSCRILQGNPKPSIRWSFKSATTGTSNDMTETTETVPLKNVRKDQTGTYECIALNAQGSDSSAMKLVVEYSPIIKKDTTLIQIKDGDKVRISCDVTGEPAPEVKWFFYDPRLGNTAKDHKSSDHSFRFTATLRDIGFYRCEAMNKLGDAKKTTELQVYIPVTIDPPKSSNIETMVGESQILNCLADGYPEPHIKWTFQSSDPKVPPKDVTPAGGVVSLALKHLQLDEQGSYTCEAENGIGGSASITYNVTVYAPPVIVKTYPFKKFEAIKGDMTLRIQCKATGRPKPLIVWMKNGYNLVMGTELYDMEADGTLIIKNIDRASEGSYVCQAENFLGPVTERYEVTVIVPVTISSNSSNIETMVGESQILNCSAEGYPEPHIKWTFQSSDPKVPPKDVTPAGGVVSLALKHLQLDEQGSYTCEAENGIGGSASITYNVTVYAPPVIVKTYPFKKFKAMEGDMTLRIQCKATGSPKPSIVWMKNGYNLAMGTEWYDMEADGTLIIKNIDRASEGSYVCQAENFLGHVTERYEVTVLDHLVPAVPTSTIFIKEGETVNINCGIPHLMTDQMRWYKDSLASISNGDLTLHSVTRSDDGLYTCRVSNPYKSWSVTTKVVVEYKPEFATKEKEIVEFIHGTASVSLSCEAYGQPKPTTATWKHNGNTLVSTEMSYPLEMVYGATGTYECEVSNVYGSIRRTFKVTSRDCILDIKKDFPQKQPIMFSPSLTWPEFPVKDGYMIIPHRDYFYMHCPSLFSDPSLPEYPMVYCECDNTIQINGKILNFADIQCNEEVKPQVSRSGNPCLRGKTEKLEIGYKVKSKFLGVFEVCLDTKNNVPLFTKHMLSPYHTDSSTEAAWSNSLLPQDFDTLYDCSRQTYDITYTLGRGLSTRDSCCFGKRQLVNSHNLLPGIPTSSAYDYLNVIPHWSTCNSKNWEDVEQSVRKLVKTTGHNLTISTGTTNPRRGGASTDIILHDGRGGMQSVASYLWKVVQDPAQSASLVIIQINIPELSAAEASKYVLCQDICLAGITWIDPSNWQNVEDGYTYCCSVNDFEKAFGYNSRFSPLMRNVLL